MHINGKLKTLDEIKVNLIDKQNWLCEFKILKEALKPIITRLNCPFIIPKETDKFSFLFGNGYYNIKEQNCKFYYKNFISQKFAKPLHQSFYSREYNIEKYQWEQIYKNKIKLIGNKEVSEFNYKLLNNILCTNQFLSKCKIRNSSNCVYKL